MKNNKRIKQYPQPCPRQTTGIAARPTLPPETEKKRKCPPRRPGQYARVTLVAKTKNLRPHKRNFCAIKELCALAKNPKMRK